jgi:hypothetical protein
MGINLLDLPNELLLHLGELSPISVPNSLILTNRHLAELLNPILWRLEGSGAENIGLNPADLSMELQPSINSAEELLPYAISTNNPLMMKKVLQHSRLDYQSDPDMINYTFQTALEIGQDECVQMLLAAMEEQHMPQSLLLMSVPKHSQRLMSTETPPFTSPSIARILL